MSIYVHSPSPYFIVKEWLARILLLLLLQKKKPTGNSPLLGYGQRK